MRAATNRLCCKVQTPRLDHTQIDDSKGLAATGPVSEPP